MYIYREREFQEHVGFSIPSTMLRISVRRKPFMHTKTEMRAQTRTLKGL